MYHIVRFDNGGESLTVLHSANTEDGADSRLDHFSVIFPNAYIDILTSAELKHAQTR